jgi:hypothetical protein
MLNILAIADRPPSVPIFELIHARPPDVIVTLGDLELSQIRELSEIHDIPKIGVYGNHCSGQYMESLGITNMHLKTVTIAGITFGGFEGSVRYKSSIYAKMYTQEEASALLAAFPHVDVMLTHCPPFGINDEPDEIAHQGFRGLHDYAARQRPRYLLHGHTYPKDGEIITHFEDTEIVYVFGEKFVELRI